ncbi:unnamed protein product [Symbiodinium natans]|uniref:Uncharacterized protein n=1 Tax=Symbiodinium natans TaxID=878477 RepID=A0A812UE96_9DINO|nr:unnamed protein product [Symbiodinium natans]
MHGARQVHSALAEYALALDQRPWHSHIEWQKDAFICPFVAFTNACTGGTGGETAQLCELRTRAWESVCKVCVNCVYSVCILEMRRARPTHSALAKCAASVKLARLQHVASWP